MCKNPCRGGVFMNPASAQKRIAFGYNRDGNKIVIVGGSYYATAVAVSEFKSLFSKTVPYVKKNLYKSVTTLYINVWDRCSPMAGPEARA